MSKFGSDIKIHKTNLSSIKLCEFSPFPTSNGNYTFGTDVESGVSNNLAKLRLSNFNIDENGDLTTTEIWEKELDNLVGTISGTKQVDSAFDPFSERLFCRLASSSTETGVQNVIQEIDPADGSYIGSSLDLTEGGFGGSGVVGIEINKQGEIYVMRSNGKGVQIYDLDLSLVRSYSTHVNNTTTTPFGVDDDGNIAIVDRSDDALYFYEKDGTLLFSLSNTDIGSSSIEDVRVNNTHLLVQGSGSIYYVNKNTQNVDWQKSFNVTTIAFDFNGNILAGRKATNSFLQRRDKQDGSLLWETKHADGGGNNPDINRISVISTSLIMAHSHALGSLRAYDYKGNQYSTALQGGRGRASFHPFNNYRIANYIQ